MNYLVMPFGLMNVPLYSRLWSTTSLGDVINRYVFVYLDDILIFSESMEEHFTHVCLLLQRLLENRLSAKAEKCKFHRSTVQFPGFMVARGRLEMDPSKTKAVVSWPTPSKELQRFLGFANFYRRFIRGFSSTVRPPHCTHLNQGPIPLVVGSWGSVYGPQDPVHHGTYPSHAWPREAVNSGSQRLRHGSRRSVVPTSCGR